MMKATDSLTKIHTPERWQIFIVAVDKTPTMPTMGAEWELSGGSTSSLRSFIQSIIIGITILR